MGEVAATRGPVRAVTSSIVATGSRPKVARWLFNASSMNAKRALRLERALSAE